MTDYPVTAAVRVLRESKIAFDPHLYDYEEKGGTARSSQQLGVEEHVVIKTLVMEDDSKKPLIILMHGDKEVSTKNLARFLKVKSVTPCDPKTAEKYTGYQVGGTSPFGTKRKLPVFVEKSILELPKIYINGGMRGFLVSIEPKFLVLLLTAQPVEVAV